MSKKIKLNEKIYNLKKKDTEEPLEDGWYITVFADLKDRLSESELFISDEIEKYPKFLEFFNNFLELIPKHIYETIDFGDSDRPKDCINLFLEPDFVSFMDPGDFGLTEEEINTLNSIIYSGDLDLYNGYEYRFLLDRLEVVKRENGINYKLEY